MEPNLSQALHLMNGDTVNAKIQQGGLVPTMLKEKKTPTEIITEIYVRSFCRKPSEIELNKLVAVASEDENPQQALEDIFWSLLNSREFLFNH